MKQLKTKNHAYLVEYCSENGIKYEVITDGWEIIIYYHDEEDLFRIGCQFGKSAYIRAND